MPNLTEDAIQKIADLGEQAEAARIRTLDNGAQVLTTPGLESVAELSPAWRDAHGLKLDAPHHIKAMSIIQTADSLVDYIKRYKTNGTVLFADISKNTIRAVLDYHESVDKTGHSDHVAALVLPFSEEWREWTTRDGVLDDQLSFARFLRENSGDITAPDAASLLETVKDIHAIRNVNFTQAVKLNSDNESFEYQDKTNVTTRGELNIPEEFTLRLPVYFNGETTTLKAWLRHKIEDSKLKLGFNLYRAEHVRQAVFKEIAADIAARAEVPVVYAAT